LEACRRCFHQILVPLGMIVAAAVGGDHHKGLLMSEKKQRHSMVPARPCPGRGQKQHVVVDEAAADSSAGEFENDFMQR